MKKLRDKHPNHEWLGIKKGAKETGFYYEWITVTETLERAKNIAAGIMALNLAPQKSFEEKDWRFMGI